jgi:TolB protein
MKKKYGYTSFCLIIVAVLLLPGSVKAKYDYIDITSPYLRKLPIAVPVFRDMTGSSDEQIFADSASNLLFQTLDFTGYFKLISREAFLEYPREKGITELKLNFRNWTSIGSELLITGGVWVTGDKVKIELRLFDTFKERMILGKLYKGNLSDQRRIIRKFCGEVIYQLTGGQGIFSSRIAFVSTGTGNKEIYTCDFDGFNPRQLTNTKAITLSPAWSSDGKWMAYTSYARGKPHLYIKNIKEKRGAVVSKPGVNITPAWIPGQFSLAATLSFSGDPEIYMLTGTGKIIKRLTNMWGIDVSPTFSPDGKQMAFVSKRSGTPQIYIKDLTSGNVRRLTFDGQYNTTPSWAPRGDKIAYSSLSNGQFNIYVIDISGQNLRGLTQNAGDNESPTWSPDGSLIAFSSTREGKSRIYVMTAYGTEQRRLFKIPGEQTNPKWSPKNIDN